MIIIKTPQPDVEERLVLVPPESCTPVFDDGKPAGLSIRAQGARDATPEDLARAGYVPAFSDLEASRDHYRDAHRHAIARAERAERERDAQIARADDAEASLARVLGARWAAEAERDTLLAELADAKAECQGAMLSAYAQYAETVRERDEAREAMASVVEQLRGRDEETQRLVGTLRERNEAKEFARVLEVERDTLLAELADAKAERDRAIRDCAATAAERNEARAEVARLGVAHERARQQPAQDRATDEELERAFYAAYDPVVTDGQGAISARSAGLLAVAASVRGERCLVTRAVAANVDIRVCEDDGGGFMVGVHAPGCDEELARCVPASEVPATLARLLGEVARG